MYLVRKIAMWLIAQIYLFKLNSLYETYIKLFLENSAYVKIARTLFNKYSITYLNGNESRGIYINSRFNNITELVTNIRISNEKIEAYITSKDTSLLTSIPTIKAKDQHWIYAWIDDVDSINMFFNEYVLLHEYFLNLKYSDTKFLYTPAASKIEAILLEAHEFIVDTIQIQHI